MRWFPDAFLLVESLAQSSSWTNHCASYDLRIVYDVSWNVRVLDKRERGGDVVFTALVDGVFVDGVRMDRNLIFRFFILFYLECDIPIRFG